VLRKTGIGFVPYSLLWRGMLTGRLTKESIPDEKDFRRFLPRTSDEKEIKRIEFKKE
jgi:aryl-alcohol dehydrogenase-like predicted oxidoreductase